MTTAERVRSSPRQARRTARRTRYASWALTAFAVTAWIALSPLLGGALFLCAVYLYGERRATQGWADGFETGYIRGSAEEAGPA